MFFFLHSFDAYIYLGCWKKKTMPIEIKMNFFLKFRNVSPMIILKRYQHQTTIDVEEVVKHSHLASEWWNPNGPMKALHSMNQIRFVL